MMSCPLHSSQADMILFQSANSTFESETDHHKFPRHAEENGGRPWWQKWSFQNNNREGASGKSNKKLTVLRTVGAKGPNKKTSLQKIFTS